MKTLVTPCFGGRGGWKKTTLCRVQGPTSPPCSSDFPQSLSRTESLAQPESMVKS